MHTSQQMRQVLTAAPLHSLDDCLPGIADLKRDRTVSLSTSSNRLTPHND
ncbi:MAG TPA: hypothetical protein V6C98_15760 [Thermosynechococcaceae cyanobacterium]